MYIELEYFPHLNICYVYNLCPIVVTLTFLSEYWMCQSLNIGLFFKLCVMENFKHVKNKENTVMNLHLTLYITSIITKLWSIILSQYVYLLPFLAYIILKYIPQVILFQPYISVYTSKWKRTLFLKNNNNHNTIIIT